MTILYIDLARSTHLFDYFIERTSGFVFAFVKDSNQMEIFKEFFVFINRKDYGCLLAALVGYELKVS
ncbi:MAG TPA: hypothetical protein VNG71_15625 [Pyrinomonadaceae bacterium]|nr:hypothetical protein [Pyrinomonadaceae bacterium]